MTAETATLITRPKLSGVGSATPSDDECNKGADAARADARVLPLSMPSPESDLDASGSEDSDAVSVPPLRARVRKRSISIAGHATSVSMEDPFWEALREIATARGCSVADLVRRVDAARATGGPTEGKAAPPVNLSSALRVFILDAVRNP